VINDEGAYAIARIQNFNQEHRMTALKMYASGTRIMDSAIYADYPLPKALLAEALGTSHKTIWRYKRLAYQLIPAFREDTPVLPKEFTNKRGREVLLSPYQIWIVSLIKASYTHLQRKSAVEFLIKSNPHLFTKATYQRYLFKTNQKLVAA
jgi:lambda repressor-like predicted transcriptional regulator